MNFTQELYKQIVNSGNKHFVIENKISFDLWNICFGQILVTNSENVIFFLKNIKIKWFIVIYELIHTDYNRFDMKPNNGHLWTSIFLFLPQVPIANWINQSEYRIEKACYIHNKCGFIHFSAHRRLAKKTPHVGIKKNLIFKKSWEFILRFFDRQRNSFLIFLTKKIAFLFNWIKKTKYISSTPNLLPWHIVIIRL